MSKYHAKKTTIDGITFDSKHEAEIYIQLRQKEKLGLIHDLQLQVEFELIPAQRAPSTFTKRGKEKLGKVKERKCSYYADFCYKDADDNWRVLDAKGVRTESYKIKKKLMLWVHGIEIEEV